MIIHECTRVKSRLIIIQSTQRIPFGAPSALAIVWLSAIFRASSAAGERARLFVHMCSFLETAFKMLSGIVYVSKTMHSWIRETLKIKHILTREYFPSSLFLELIVAAGKISTLNIPVDIDVATLHNC
jgi:hypothetical protein